MKIRMLDLVLKQCPEDSKEPQTARILLYKLFYDQTEEGMTQFLLNLIKSFETHKQSKRFYSCILRNTLFWKLLLDCVDTKSSVASFSELYNLTLKLFTVLVYKWDSFYWKFLHTSNKNEDIIIHVLVIMSVFCIYLTLNPLQCWISLVIKCYKSCCVIIHVLRVVAWS